MRSPFGTALSHVATGVMKERGVIEWLWVTGEMETERRERGVEGVFSLDSIPSCSSSLYFSTESRADTATHRETHRGRAQRHTESTQRHTEERFVLRGSERGKREREREREEKRRDGEQWSDFGFCANAQEANA